MQRGLFCSLSRQCLPFLFFPFLHRNPPGQTEGGNRENFIDFIKHLDKLLKKRYDYK